MSHHSHGGRRVIFSIWYRIGIIVVPVSLFMWKFYIKQQKTLETVL